MSEALTASMMVIGNEILSGRTQDKNLWWIAGQLKEMGIRLKEAAVVADDEAQIIDTLNRLRKTYDVVFTSGGIGPTHDDITSLSIAHAFRTELHRDPEAERILHGYYAENERTPQRMKMADLPVGAVLVPNPISAAPGFRMENVYVMAGVPSIFQAMFKAIRHELRAGPPIRSITVTVFLPEGNIAGPLEDIQHQFSDVEIGSYPFGRENRIGTNIVASSTEEDRLHEVCEAITRMLDTKKAEYQILDTPPSIN